MLYLLVQQGHPTMAFCEISVRRGLGCLGISIHKEPLTNSFGYFGHLRFSIFCICVMLCSPRIFEISFASSSPEKIRNSVSVRLHNFSLFLSLFPSHSFRKLKYPFKTSIETTPSVELIEVASSFSRLSYYSTLRDVPMDLMDGKRPKSFIITSARVIAGTNVTFVLFECCITEYFAFPVRFRGFAPTFPLSFSTFRSRYLGEQTERPRW